MCTLLENVKLGAANRVGKLADLRSSHSLFTDATLKKEIKIKINKKKWREKEEKRKKNKKDSGAELEGKSANICSQCLKVCVQQREYT